jgi:hypothetical protein
VVEDSKVAGKDMAATAHCDSVNCIMGSLPTNSPDDDHMKINRTHMLNYSQHVGRHSISAFVGINMHILDIDLDHRTLMDMANAAVSKLHTITYTDGPFDLSTKLVASVPDGFAKLVKFCV